MDFQGAAQLMEGNGPNPIKLSTADTAVLIGHVLHLLVGGQSLRPQGKEILPYVLVALQLLKSWIGLVLMLSVLELILFLRNTEMQG